LARPLNQIVVGHGAKARRRSKGAEVIAFDTELLRQELTLSD
jgi:hypothetical protein